jgi:hypothetical protein
MKAIIELINKETSLQTLGCCCGHGIYPMTVVVKKGKRIYELMTGIDIPRKRLFYQRDKKGVFYIPELVDGKYGWNHRR